MFNRLCRVPIWDSRVFILSPCILFSSINIFTVLMSREIWFFRGVEFSWSPTAISAHFMGGIFVIVYGLWTSTCMVFCELIVLGLCASGLCGRPDVDILVPDCVVGALNKAVCTSVEGWSALRLGVWPFEASLVLAKALVGGVGFWAGTVVVLCGGVLPALLACRRGFALFVGSFLAFCNV